MMPRQQPAEEAIGEETYLLGSIREEGDNDDIENCRSQHGMTSSSSCGGADRSNTTCCCCRNVIQWSTNTILAVLSIVAIVLCAIQQHEIDELDNELHDIEQQSHNDISDLSTKVASTQKFTVLNLAGTFVLITCLITTFHMRQHIITMQDRPTEMIQCKILAILVMCPIYSLTSYLSIIFPVGALTDYLVIIKDCYEAYVIYQFLSFLIAVLGKGNRQVVVDLLAKTHTTKRPLPPPMMSRIFRNCKTMDDDDDNDDSTDDDDEEEGSREEKERRHPPSTNATKLAYVVLLECQIFALQFVLLRPILSMASFVIDTMHDEPLPTWNWTSPKFYLLMVQNVSVFLAFTGLLRFYHIVHEYIEWIDPFPKFLCIKGVVFMTFWQGLVISLVLSFGHDGDNNTDDDTLSGNDDVTGSLTPQESASRIQNLLICLEMLGFCIAHYFVFPTQEWEEGYIRRRIRVSVGDTIAFGDFISDVQTIYKSSERLLSSSSTAEANSNKRRLSASTAEDSSSSVGSIT